MSERQGGGSPAFSNIVTQAWYALSEDVNMRILFIGDVVGTSGVAVLSEMLPSLRSRWSIDLTVVNGENSAEQGFGITFETYRAIRDAGGDDLAPKFYPILSSLRPLDLPGWAVVATGAGAEPSA